MKEKNREKQSKNYEDLLIRVHVTNRFHPFYKKVVTLKIEKYLSYCLPGFYRPAFTEDVYKALAVLCRSQAYRKCMSPLLYDVDDRRDLPYRPDLSLTSEMKNALQSTEGLCLTYAGHPIEAAFCFANGGVQRSAKEKWGSEVRYLVHRKDGYDHSRFPMGSGVGLSLTSLVAALEEGVSWQEVLLQAYPHTKLEKNVRTFHCPNICFGAKGVKVALLQSLLNEQGEKLQADGVFGIQTERAVKHFRMQHALRFSCVVDGFFWDALLGNRELVGEKRIN